MAKILVTGGAGFIGSHLVDGLVDKENQVSIIDNLSTGKIENINPKTTFHNADICDAAVDGIFQKEKPEIVFHLAAQIDVRKSVADPLADAQTNILGSLNIIETARRHNVKKIIFTSTGGAIYGDADVVPTPETYRELPLSPYGIAKLSIEKYLYYYGAVFGLRYAVLRLANVYGPRQNSKGEAGVVAIFCDKMLAGQQPVINGAGRQTRDFVYVDDVVAAETAALRVKKNGTYNIGTGKETNINGIFKQLNRLLGSNFKMAHAPAKPGEQKRSCLDIAKAKKELGWQPEHGVEDGLKKTAEWFLESKKI